MEKAKNIYIILSLAVFLMGFIRWNKSDSPEKFDEEWVQYLGPDSVKYVYSFKDTAGVKLLQRIIVQERNPGDGGSHMFSNVVTFDKTGKIWGANVTRKVFTGKNEFGWALFYDRDRVGFENDTISSVLMVSDTTTIMHITRSGDVLCAIGKKEWTPIYRYPSTEAISMKPIGKGADPRKDVKDFQMDLEKGIYKKYQQKSRIGK